MKTPAPAASPSPEDPHCVPRQQENGQKSNRNQSQHNRQVKIIFLFLIRVNREKNRLVCSIRWFDQKGQIDFYWWVLNPTGRSIQGQTPIKRRIRKKTRSKLSTEMQPGKLGWTRSILHVMRSNLAFNFFFYYFIYLFILNTGLGAFSAMKKGKKVHKSREKAEIKQ